MRADQRALSPLFNGLSLGLGLRGGLLITIALLLAAPPALAQQPDSTQLRRFRLADSYLRAGQHERAIIMLEDLHAESPDTYAFYNKLKQAYEEVKRYDDAIKLVEQRMGQARTPARMSEKARLLYLKGDEEAAFNTWDEALTLAPNKQTTYRVVYGALVDIRRFDRAIDVLERGRETIGAPHAFQTEIAYLYSLNGQHTKAMKEYLNLLEDNQRRLSFVRSRLSAFITQDDALQASIKAINAAVREHPLNQAYRELLAWLYMEDEQYAKAFDVYRAIDRLAEENGRRLLTFAQQAADARAFEAALGAYQEILDRYPNSPAAPEAQRGLGGVHRAWANAIDERVFDDEGNRIEAPHYEAAAEAYRTYLQRYPERSAYPLVLRTLGRLQQDVFLKLGEAEATLQKVVEHYPNSQAADEARYDLGRIALMRDNLSEARLTFQRLVDELRTGDLAEQARYELALLHFYQGEFDAALTRAEATNANTSTDVANDAIGLKVLLLQNKGPDSLNTPLKTYARAKLLQRQRRYDSALHALDTLMTTYGGHPLTDEARFLRAQILRDQHRAEAAMEAFAEIPLMHPRSPLADRSLFAAAEIQANMLHDAEGALKLYTRLLEKYPNSLLTSKARDRIRTLQGQKG